MERMRGYPSPPRAAQCSFHTLLWAPASRFHTQNYRVPAYCCSAGSRDRLHSSQHLPPLLPAPHGLYGKGKARATCACCSLPLPTLLITLHFHCSGKASAANQRGKGKINNRVWTVPTWAAALCSQVALGIQSQACSTSRTSLWHTCKGREAFRSQIIF